MPEVSWEQCIRLGMKTALLQSAQEQSGICFDIEKAKALTEHIRAEMKALEEATEPSLPPRKLKAAERHQYTLPVRPYKKDGSLSEVMLKWLAKHNVEACNDNQILWHDNIFYKIEGSKELPASMPMKLGNQEDIKDWLLTEGGWEPTLWNLKRGPDGKPLRDEKTKEPVKTSPKMQENGKLCPNLEAMQGGLVKQVVKWLSYRNRLSVLEGWLGNRRLAFDGRLSAASSGITPTFRQRHSVVANIPKNKEHVLLGKEMRSLFVAAPGKVLVGFDASSLEDRLKGHFTHTYDGGAYAAKILSEGFDPHQENADLWGIDRSIAKNGTYALGYFCGVKKLAATIKCSQSEASLRHEAYWELNKPLKDLDDALGRHWEANGKKYIVGLDGRKVWSRARHSLVNLLIQSTGSIVMDFAGAWLDRKLGSISLDSTMLPCYHYKGHQIKRTIFMHDEFVLETDPEVAEEVLELGKQSIAKAGQFYKLKVPLLSEGRVALTWADLK